MHMDPETFELWQKTVTCATIHYNQTLNLSSSVSVCCEQLDVWFRSEHTPLHILGRRFILDVILSSSTSNHDKNLLYDWFIDQINHLCTDYELTRMVPASLLISVMTDLIKRGEPDLQFTVCFRIDWNSLQKCAKFAIYNMLSSGSESSRTIKIMRVFLDDLLTLCRRCLKFLLSSEVDSGDRSLLSGVALFAIDLLQNSLELKLPGSLTFNLLRILQKLTEIAFFGDWRFAIRCNVPAWSGNICDRLISLLRTLSSNLLPRLVNERADENSSMILTSFAQRSLMFLLYTFARTALAIDSNHMNVQVFMGTWGTLLNYRQEGINDAIVHLVQSDDVILFRTLITLLLTENKIIKNGLSTIDAPSAHLLFASLLSAIDFDRHVVIDWLVSPETDCLTYLLAYCKRVSGHRVDPALWTIPSSFDRIRVAEFMRELSISIEKHRRASTFPYSPNMLCIRLEDAHLVLTT